VLAYIATLRITGSKSSEETPAIARRSAAHAAQTREDILAGARALFAQQGFSETTVEQISRAAGVTVGALFHHFGGKQALFRAVFADLEAEMAEAAQAASQGEGARAQFLAGVRRYLEFCARPDFHRIVMVDGPVVLGDAEWRNVDARLGMRALRSAIPELIAAGSVRPQPVEPLALLFFGALNVAGFAMARSEAAADPEPFLQAFASLLD
jgi:AcrR family transcriptional regulator